VEKNIMIVDCIPHMPKAVWDKTVYIGEFMSGMVYHFQDKEFGESIKEVAYNVVSGDSVFLVSFGEGITYGRRNKSLGSLFETNYETIQSLEGEALLKHVGEQLIAETKKFAEKKIKDFDLEGYIKSLEEYFNEAMQSMREGKRPDEGKVANEEIQIARAKKWSRL
jgi:hypothetical protein